MRPSAPTQPAYEIRRVAHPLGGSAHDFDALLAFIGDARFVLIGEATHGTHEFYRTRALLTQRLIQEQGFSAVAVEADWPDASRVNRYVLGLGRDTSASDALDGFLRSPTWMWRNADVLDFVGWLRAHNNRLSASATKTGFYGLDLYSLYTSMEAVIAYLDRVDPYAARRARDRYSCFEQYNQDSQAYGYAATFGAVELCEQAVVTQLMELREHALQYARQDGDTLEDEFFFAEQNDRIALDAEQYYRTMFYGGVASWNLRDRHMADTLDQLVAHLDRHGARTKVVVWEHNSHIGDARATELGDSGELNVGQLVRERHGQEAILIGFSTHSGTVTVAADWGNPPERKRVRPALRASYESLLHATDLATLWINLRSQDVAAVMRSARLERAIGVVYRPETERLSHYFEARLADQFDAVIHFDETRAVEPLERTPQWGAGEPPETYPSAL